MCLSYTNSKLVDELYTGFLDIDYNNSSWQKHLTSYAYSLRTAITATPGLIEILSARPSITPMALKHTDASYKILMEAGFLANQADFINHSVGIFIMGICSAEFSKEIVPTQFPTTDELKQKYSNLYQGYIQQDWDNYFNNMFEFGLNNMIAGFESLLRGLEDSR